MARDGTKNLIPLNERSKEEQRKIQSMGGIASGEARRRKKKSKEIATMLLDLEITDAKGKKVLEKLGITEADMQNRTLLLARVMRDAITKGDKSAARLILEVAGELEATEETPDVGININISPATEADREAEE